LNICEIDPVTGACTPAPSVTTTIDENETPTFIVTATSEGTIPPDPANSRIFVPFLDEQGEVRGLTSVAVASLLQPEQGQVLPGTWRDDENDVCFNVSADANRLTPEGSTCAGGSSLNLALKGFNASGIPCDVDVSTDKEIQIVNGTFSFVDITEDGSPLGVFRTAFVFGQFEDPVLLNVGAAATFQDVEGFCPGVWLDAQPEALLAPSGP